MGQLHTQFNNEQIKVLLQRYCQGKMRRVNIQEILDVCKTRFFALFNVYRQEPDSFSFAYHRENPTRLSTGEEAEIEKALIQKQEIAEDPDLPISGYYYTDLKDMLLKKGLEVSVTTIIDQAMK